MPETWQNNFGPSKSRQILRRGGLSANRTARYHLSPGASYCMAATPCQIGTQQDQSCKAWVFSQVQPCIEFTSCADPLNRDLAILESPEKESVVFSLSHLLALSYKVPVGTDSKGKTMRMASLCKTGGDEMWSSLNPSNLTVPFRTSAWPFRRRFQTLATYR